MRVNVAVTSAARSSRLNRRLYVAPSSLHGQGCFARIRFESGDWIGTFEGTEVVRDDPHVLWFYNAESAVLIGRRGNTLLRWLNHHDAPNAEFDGFDLYARRAIAAEEEITVDYGATP